MLFNVFARFKPENVSSSYSTSNFLRIPRRRQPGCRFECRCWPWNAPVESFRYATICPAMIKKESRQLPSGRSWRCHTNLNKMTFHYKQVAPPELAQVALLNAGKPHANSQLGFVNHFHFVNAHGIPSSCPSCSSWLIHLAGNGHWSVTNRKADDILRLPPKSMKF